MLKRFKSKVPAAHAVGYKRPPTHTQFKPGRSGNPAGRPRGGAVNLATVAAKTFLEKITIIEKGRRRKITMLEALFKQQTNKAVTGDGRAFSEIMKVAKMLEDGLSTAGSAPESLPEADQQVMKSLLARIQHYANGAKEE
jgi:hypothetical protein